MKNTLLIVALFISTLVVGQQSTLLQFEETIHDFGTVKEEDGPIVYEFKFINNSPDSVKVLRVKASCGCTTPGWSKEAIAPGDAGYIKAQYNTRNRPGSFNKSLTVTTNLPENSSLRLYIKGVVTPRPKTIEEELPSVMGGLRMKYNSFNVGKVYAGNKPTVKSFEVYNETDKEITFLDKIDKPACIEVSVTPKTIAPKSKGEITVTYDGEIRNDFGFVTDNVTLYTDEEDENSQKSFTVYATIEEYFAPMSAEEYANAPQLTIEEVVHDFGKIKMGEQASHIYLLKNTGQSELNIRATKSTCTCATVNLKKDTIKPGKSVEMEVTFNSEDRKGNQQKSVTIFSNDPRKSMQRVTIKGVVLVE